MIKWLYYPRCDKPTALASQVIAAFETAEPQILHLVSQSVGLSLKARDRQHDRFKDTNISCNATIPAGQTFDYCRFSPSAMDRFTEIIEKNKVSTRSTNRLAKVARTVADLNRADEIEPPHLDEAAQFVVGGLLRDLF